MKIFLITFYLTLMGTLLFGQDDLVSAKQLLQKMSDNFKESIKDYQADITWAQSENIQKGKLYFKNPQKMRINFSEPAEQVICTDGYELWLYVPHLNLALHQNILDKEKIKTEDGKTETIINPVLINAVGLDKFLTDYAIEYHETKNKIAYKDGTKVYKLKLIRWRSSKNGFNVIYLTIQENGLIRRVEGVTAAYRHIILEMDNIKTNTSIGENIFNYNPPAHSSTVENFITSQEE